MGYVSNDSSVSISKKVDPFNNNVYLFCLYRLLHTTMTIHLNHPNLPFLPPNPPLAHSPATSLGTTVFLARLAATSSSCVTVVVASVVVSTTASVVLPTTVSVSVTTTSSSVSIVPSFVLNVSVVLITVSNVMGSRSVVVKMKISSEA